MSCQRIERWCVRIFLETTTVITTVSSEEKAAISKANGAHCTVNDSTQDWAKEVAKITNNAGVNVGYDAVGKSTFQGSFAASGAPDAIAPLSLGPKSISLTRPLLLHYIED
ncbi:hypothetical protein BC936DRAFT_136605 [Jimgerdemannia flammicorona]|uniref:Alcohol dehydrogenase-like C-terminal domain-containing protein n=1 Tax=Jimgerdemannia flammicorona TaxID=994334 RepID=A0A433CZ69_9FUNG|nr:hypothetical protein BC936DRAFT_136605 [Jimgerdemannia flammicorona]